LRKNRLFLSSGMATFKRLEELRVTCGLGVDSMILNTGGFLPISHVTYRDWQRLLEEAEDTLLKTGRTVIVTASPKKAVTLKMEMSITLLEKAVMGRWLPVDRSTKGIRNRQGMVLKALKIDLVNTLKDAIFIDKACKDKIQ